MRLPAFALLALATLGACGNDKKFSVVVTVATDEGVPLSGVPVRLGDGTKGTTDDLGQLRAKVIGEEGTRLAVAVEPPPGFSFVGTPKNAVVLRQLVDLEADNKPLPIEYEVKLAPTVRRYAVLVRTNVPGVPVAAFGEQRAVTNRLGVAMFVYQGTPGETLTVKLDTSAMPRLQPPSPVATFQLPARAQAFVVNRQFTATPERRPPRIRRIGPRRL